MPLPYRFRSCYIFIITGPTLPVSLVTECSQLLNFKFALKISIQARAELEGDIQLDIAEHLTRRFWQELWRANWAEEAQLETYLGVPTDVQLEDVD